MLMEQKKKSGYQQIGRSHGGATTKIHMICDSHGNPLKFTLSGGNAHDAPIGLEMIKKLDVIEGALIADKGYDSDEILIEITKKGGLPVIPPKSNRKNPIPHDRLIYQARHLVENLFCKLKQYRAIATRYEKLAKNYAGMVFMACSIYMVATLKTRPNLG